MTIVAATDWIFPATGWLLAAVGVALALWSLLSDRPRGRRRCPKCWYDMAGVPGLVCPECGGDAKREKRLHRTRRRPALAAAALAVLLPAGHLLAHLGDYRKFGWPALVPSSALLLWRAEVHKPPPPWTPQGPRPLTTPERLGQELGRRYSDDGLYRWQQRVLAHGDPGCVPEEWHLAVSTRPRWPEGVPLHVRVQPAWFTGKRSRHVVITPLFAGGTPVRVDVVEPFIAQDIDLGVPPIGEGPVHVRVELFEQWRSGRRRSVPASAIPGAGIAVGGPTSAPAAALPRGRERFVRLWSRRIELPVAVGGRVEEIILPAHELQLDGMFLIGVEGLEGPEPHVYVVLPSAGGLRGITMAVQVEFRDQQQKVASAEVLWQPDQFGFGRGTLTGDIPRLRVNWGAPGWRVRIAGDAHLALADHAAARFWPGEVEHPLSEVQRMERDAP